jgi:hypothetical protein
MATQTKSYETEVSGLWNTRHLIRSPDGELGTLSVSRNGAGMVRAGRFVPEEGEVLEFRRDPGILRSQFSLWTEAREWLGSSLRWSFVQREINLSTGSLALRLVPMPGFRRGWRLLAPRTGEMARIETHAFRRGCSIHVFRRMDFEVLLFAYFLGSQILSESLWPGPEAEASPPPVAATP